MSKIIALTMAALALPAAARAEPQAMKPWMPLGTAPPWGTTATTTEPTPAATPAAAEPPRIASGAVTPQDALMSTRGSATVIRAVSLRAGPNTGASVIGTLQPGTPLRVLATANHGWMQVEAPNGSGWAFGSYLAPTGSSEGIQHREPSEEIKSL